MAGIIGVLNVDEVALAATTAKTVLQILAPSNQKIKIKEWGVFFDGTSVTAEPVKVRLLRQTTAGTMSSLTAVKRSATSETLQTTGQYNATVEPGAGDVLVRRNVHPQSGYQEKFSIDDEIEVQGGSRVGIECTAPAAVNVIPEIVFEE